MNFPVVDEHGATLAQRARICRRCRSTMRRTPSAAVVQATGTLERHGLTAFPEEGVPRRVRAG